MIPIKNKKKSLEVTVEEMTNFALNYVEKFAPSKQQLRTYLLKKYLTSRTPNIKKNDVSNLIDIVLEDLEKSKFINDKFYSESKAKSLIQRGSSINKVRNYLLEFIELGLDLSPLKKHFVEDHNFPKEKWQEFLLEVKKIYNEDDQENVLTISIQDQIKKLQDHLNYFLLYAIYLRESP